MWNMSYMSAKNARDEFQARIDAFPKASIPADPPDVMLVALRRGTVSQRDLDALRCRPIAKRGPAKLEPAPRIPDRYLLLDNERPEPFDRINKPNTAGEGPFRLSVVENGKDSLLAFHYVPFNPKPSFPPVLTVHGWLHAPNSISGTQATKNLVDFVKRAIGHCIDFEAYTVPPPPRQKQPALRIDDTR